ncbi:hypothetical protein PUNSTDRAFT_128750 [Punctularia strigosozonata HHB-11173 SS5]|uniref:Uncharacterized protein n=1 Tax=Punctularia strigosozonata (strain HHB-11173) TaxID=741275 RepID=R7S132_PUNST|nr:uncharacterized protein PUNSTDRAFT_128750 [Punctularia strigosozonata HHB-11173 SS5]EIN03502.1 hypothetical protein PUNSTDRAFT_128750 [Punctularia strigosozonata HHB-11173 SS5]
MIGTVFTTILLVLLGALVFLSTPQSRRLAVFMFNFGALTLAIVTGIVSNHLQIHAILSPLATISPIENEAWVAMYLWLPWLSEAVLIIRIIAVFKQRTARLLASVLVVPITMKIFRAVLFIMYLRNWWKDSAHPGATSANSRAIASQNWIQKAICVAELTDDAVFHLVWSSGVQYKERQAISYSHRDISSSDARTAYTAYTNNDAVMISKHVHILQSPEFVDKESGKWVEHQQPDEMLLPGMDSPDARCIGIAE